MDEREYIRASLSHGELDHPELLSAKLRELSRANPEGKFILLELGWKTAMAVTSTRRALVSEDL
jgi:predicted signal transduction protein with EAL and GGDEF domain